MAKCSVGMEVEAKRNRTTESTEDTEKEILISEF